MSNPIIPREKLYLITDIPGYTPKTSRLICQMNLVRFVTMHAVENLSVSELDYLHDENSNSIGALLLHIAAVDFAYQTETLEERELTGEEFEKWKPALMLGTEGREKIRGNDLSYYTNILEDIRNRTYEILKERDDVWLEKEFLFNKNQSNNYYRWFHVTEDEINHRGQINWLRKRIKN